MEKSSNTGAKVADLDGKSVAPTTVREPSDLLTNVHSSVSDKKDLKDLLQYANKGVCKRC